MKTSYQWERPTSPLLHHGCVLAHSNQPRLKKPRGPALPWHSRLVINQPHCPSQFRLLCMPSPFFPGTCIRGSMNWQRLFSLPSNALPRIWQISFSAFMIQINGARALQAHRARFEFLYSNRSAA